MRKEMIVENLQHPHVLEDMYRNDKAGFKRAFNEAYAEIMAHQTAQVWHARLNYAKEEISWGKKHELMLVVALALMAGLMAKLPDILAIDAERYYPRNMGFIVMPFLMVYFAWRNTLDWRKMIPVGALVAGLAVYMNVLQGDNNNDPFMLASAHLPLFLWSALGYVYSGCTFGNRQGLLDFLRFNGELVPMAAIVAIAGGLLSAITIGLFGLIGINIEAFYANYIIVLGAAALPIFATFLVKNNPQLTHKISPVIARVFTPLVLVMLVAYLIAIAYTGKNPYGDREFLILFNALLVGVMAIILFSIAESTKGKNGRWSLWLLLVLSAVTVVVNGIALSAIVFRISEWGFTPNRLAVLGANVLMLANLLVISFRLWQSARGDGGTDKVEESIAVFLPAYSVWTLVVVVVFPMVF